MRSIASCATVGLTLSLLIALGECAPEAEQRHESPRREKRRAASFVEAKELASDQAMGVSSPRTRGRILDMSTVGREGARAHDSTESRQQHQDKLHQQTRNLPTLRLLIAKSHKQQRVSGPALAVDDKKLTSEEESATKIGGAVEEGPLARDETAASSLRQAKCAPAQSRAGGLRDLLAGANKLITGIFSALERRTGNVFWLGSNVLATLIPLASLLGGRGGNQPSPPARRETTGSPGAPGEHLAQHAPTANSSTDHSGGASASSKRKPIVQAITNGAGIQSRVEHVMDWLERSTERLPHFPRLHPQECVKRTICEAHEDPSKYGALGLALRLLFPAASADMSGGADRRGLAQDGSMEYKVINKYRYAASYGTSRRLASAESSAPVYNLVSGVPNNSSASNKDADSNWSAPGGVASTAVYVPPACKDKYEECLVSLLDVAQGLLDRFLRKSSSD